MSQPRLKILTYSTLFPNGEMPRHGIFVEQRLRHLVSSGEAESRVLAPVPWFPFRHPAFGTYSAYAKVAANEQRNGLDVTHPRYLRIPKVGMSNVPAWLARASIPAARRMIAGGYDFDLIDAHYFYPDGVAAVQLARALGKPVVITARGTDINLIPQYPRPRSQILWAARHADGMITVCQALKDSLVELGANADRITVLRNGVDLDLFHPTPRAEARIELELDPEARILLSVGYLIDRKGHDIVIRALASLPGTTLLIAGDGEKERALKDLAAACGVADRVVFLGSLPQERLRIYFSAADALVLASSREGWANVLLEAMACGTPVIASNVWGTPEVVADPAAGVLMDERTPDGLVAACHRLFADYPEPSATRRYAEGFSWEETTEGQLTLMRRIRDDFRATSDPDRPVT